MNLCQILRSALPAAAMVAVLSVGCAPSYENQRPPMDQLDSRDRGLQSKDVLQASDALAMDLLSLDKLNDSREQWTVVIDRVEDRTRDDLFRGDFNIFLQRLQTQLARQGRGRIALIENKAKFYDLRDRELESGGGGPVDEFGQGSRGSASGGGGGAPGAISPDYSLHATAMDLPGRGTTYYNLQFELVDLHRRQIVWTGDYEVRVSRD